MAIFWRHNEILYFNVLYYCIKNWQGDFFFFLAAYAFYILYTIAPYIKVHKLDNKINKKPHVY